MKKIAVLGLGKVGTLVALLLSKKFEVTGVDKVDPHYTMDHPFAVQKGDVTSEEFLKTLFDENDAVVSALPYFLNKTVAKIAFEKEIHYFDLTEDVETTQYIRDLAKNATTVFALSAALLQALSVLLVLILLESLPNCEI